MENVVLLLLLSGTSVCAYYDVRIPGCAYAVMYHTREPTRELAERLIRSDI